MQPSPCFGQVVEEVAGVTEGYGGEQRSAEDEHIRRRVPAAAGYLHPLDEQIDPVSDHGEAGDGEEEIEQLEQALEEPPARRHLLLRSINREPICQLKRAQNLRTIPANERRRNRAGLRALIGGAGRRREGIDYLAGDSPGAVLPVPNSSSEFACGLNYLRGLGKGGGRWRRTHQLAWIGAVGGRYGRLRCVGLAYITGISLASWVSIFFIAFGGRADGVLGGRASWRVVPAIIPLMRGYALDVGARERSELPLVCYFSNFQTG